MPLWTLGLLKLDVRLGSADESGIRVKSFGSEGEIYALNTSHWVQLESCFPLPGAAKFD